MWDHVELVKEATKNGNLEQTYRCLASRGCRREFLLKNGNGRSNINRHLKNKHKISIEGVIRPSGTMSLDSFVSKRPRLDPLEMTKTNLKTAILQAIVDMDFSFDSVERKSFISLLSLASNGIAPNLMVKADAMRDFALHMHLVNLRHWTAKALQDVEYMRQIHFTTDSWSTPARKN
ncbi:hypothetical protein OnM2_034090, partial [Erysiphe neolycopersici]